MNNPKEHFTNDEQMHICYVIGEWYLKWQHGDLNSRIGVAKEELKQMLCESKIGDFHGSYEDLPDYESMNAYLDIVKSQIENAQKLIQILLPVRELRRNDN